MIRWGMVIDLKKCIGCWACTMACKTEHFLPRNVLWNRILIGEIGKYPSVAKEMYPILCKLAFLHIRSKTTQLQPSLFIQQIWMETMIRI